MIPWEGFADIYRDALYHGGLLCIFMTNWFTAHLLHHHLGRASTQQSNPWMINVIDRWLQNNLDNGVLAGSVADWDKIDVPFYSAGNWTGFGLHLRGNTEAFMRSQSPHKKLRMQNGTHVHPFYSAEGRQDQIRFFDYWLKGEKNGWDKQPPVQLNVRHPGEKFVLRHENEWPLARTQWTKFYLDTKSSALSATPVAAAGKVEYVAMGKGVTFTTAPLAVDTEITGPMAAKLFVSSSTADADLFVIVRVFDPAGRELTFMGSTDPNTPIANGWLRVSHRRLDPAKSKPYRPYHPHDRAEMLTPGEIYECDVEIVTSCIVVPAGWRIALTVRGKVPGIDQARFADLAKQGEAGCPVSNALRGNVEITVEAILES